MYLTDGQCNRLIQINISFNEIQMMITKF